MDSFKLNRIIAYKGQLGRRRERFCIDYITRKQIIFDKLFRKQKDIATLKSETITCSKGCNYCCVLMVSASIQEGEAIVYYLYQNQSLLDRFTKEYPLWRARVREAGDLFKKPPKNQDNSMTDKLFQGEAKHDELGDLAQYAKQEINCPFLDDGICSIYEVRPFSCAGLMVTTPSKWCSPSHPNYNKKKTYQTFNPDSHRDLSFYYQELKEPVWSFMPIMVYNMLKNGISGIPKIPGLENLLFNYMKDPQVQSVIRRYQISKNKS